MRGKIEGTILYESRAANRLSKNYAHGRLYLMREKVIFISNIFMLGGRNESYEMEFPLKAITKIHLRERYGFWPSKIVFEFENGRREHFSVPKRSVWMEHIRRLRPDL